jgi:hypothetical protein
MEEMTTSISGRIIPIGFRCIEPGEVIMQGDWAAIDVRDDGTIIWQVSNDVGKLARVSEFFHVCDFNRVPIKQAVDSRRL